MLKKIPKGGWFSIGQRPRENHPPEGNNYTMLPHWDVIFVSLYQTKPTMVIYQ